jgi:hypothetical protein
MGLPFIYLFISVPNAPHSFSQQQQYGSGKKMATAATSITSINNKCDSSGGGYQ